MRRIGVLAILLALCTSLKATTYYVNDASTTGDVYTTAIGNNGNTGASTQPFATLTFALTVATGSDTIIVDSGNYSDKNITISSTQSGIVIRGASITSTIFDGTPHSGIFNFMNLTGTNIHIESMTVTEYDNAGAFDITASSALDSSRIYFKDVYLYRNETFVSFDANPQGGAIWIGVSGGSIPAAVYCDNCHFGDNLAEQGAGGGAIYITGRSNLILIDCRFTCNNSRGILTTYEGGAIFFNQSSGKIRSTFISGSPVFDQQGGAIRTLNNTATAATLELRGCTFTDNRARQGAALYVEGRYTCNIINSLFYDNHVAGGFGDGGTINCTGSGANQPTMSIINSTIADNTVLSGSDGAGLSNESAASYTVYNSIIWGNQTFNVNATATITATYCDIEPVGDMHSGVLGNINTNPQFTGGTDYTLQGTSPCINTGNLAGAPTNDITLASRTGNPDMGCFELGSTNPTTSLVCTLFMNCNNPVITSATPASSICTGSVFSTSLSSSPTGATYVWSSPDVVGITGHSNNGTGDINETLTNTTGSPLVVTYTVTPYSGACIGTQVIYSVTVNPIPTITSAAPTNSICSNTLFATSLSANTGGSTTYAWTSPSVVGITGHSTSGTGDVSETLVNTTTGVLTVTYTITPSLGSCSGTPVVYSVDVQPTSTITSSAPATSICSNTLFSTSLTTNTSSGITSLDWTSPSVAGITGHSTSGTGNISETLVNTTNGVLTVSYTITPSVNGCNGTPVVYSVDVQPTSTITSSAPATSICSNTLFSTSLTTNTASGITSLDWTSPSVSGITGHSTSGTGNISETLVNTTTGVLTVTYTITPSVNGCNGTPVVYSVDVHPTSTITSSAPTTSICSNTLFSTSLTTNTSSGITSLDWTSPSVAGITGHSTSGTGNISETLVNTTNGVLTVTYTITPSVNGCDGTPVVYSVDVQPTSTITSATPTTSICTGDLFSTSITTNTSSGITSLDWTSPSVTGITGHSTSGTGDISETLVNTTNGVLTVTYTITPSVNGCDGTPVVYSVDVNVVEITMGADQEITCTSPSVTISGSSTTSGVIYAWTNASNNPAGTTPSNSSTDVNVAGTYTLTVTDPSTGCSITGTVDVTVSSSLPDITMGLDQELNCLVSSVTIDGSSSISNPVYSWTDALNNPAGTTPNASTTDVTSPGTYTLTVTDPSNGCSISGNINVTLNPDPISVAGLNDTLTCNDVTLVLDGTGSSVGSSFSYNWTGPGIVSGGTTLNPTIDQPGTYSLEVTDSNTGCVSSTDVEILIDTISPIANASSLAEINCTNTQINLDASSSTGSNLQFSWTGPGIVSGGNTSTPLVDQAGTYDLILTNSSNGCSDNFSVNVTIDTLAPVIVASNDTTINCGVGNIILTVTEINNATYVWSASVPGIVSGSNTDSVTVNQAGIYFVMVTGPNGCSSTDAVNVSLGSGPNASFTVTPTSGQSPLVVTTNNSSTGIDLDYLWNFDNGMTSTAIDTSSTYIQNGNYTIVLIVTDSLGCRDTAFIQITVDASDLDIPDGFTPNGDGINDVFEIVGIEQYPENKISIFNRWGDLVFSAQPYINDWNGNSNNPILRISGDKVVDGTYFFVLELAPDIDPINGYVEMKSR